MGRKRKFGIILFMFVLSVYLGLYQYQPIEVEAAESNVVVNYALSTVGVKGWDGLCLAYVRQCFDVSYGISSSSCCAFRYGNSFIDSTSRYNIPLGADVFFSGSSKTCPQCGNKCGHIGIYVGDDYIVHAWAGTISKTKIDYVISCGYPYRGWGWHGNYGLENMPVSDNPDDYPQVSTDLFYQQSSIIVGPQVGYVQAVLKYLGYNISIDQSYGPSTRDTVKQFQNDHGLTADGSCGPQTRAKLVEAYQAKKNENTGHPHETAPPVITDVKVTNITSTGYTVSCRATDESGISRVQFPTWTLAGEQDDIQQDWVNNIAASGIRNGDVFTYRIKDSEHNYERGTYLTHIYAFDQYGNYACDNTVSINLKNIFKPVSSVSFNGHIYELYNDLLSWAGAREKCKALGGYLATITSQKEQDAVNALLGKGERSGYFIGGSDEIEEGKFCWITGEPFSYTNWSPGNPDNFKGIEHYMEICSNGKWNDEDNASQDKGFILEKEQKPSSNGTATKPGKQFVIVYRMNGGRNNPKNPSVYSSSQVTMLKKPTKAGYNFNGWYLNNKIKVDFIPKGKTGELRLSARWEIVKKPSKAKIMSITRNSKKKMTVKMKPMRKIDGYQMFYANNSKLLNYKKQMLSNKSVKTVGKLQNKKIYYVKVRAFRLDSAKNKIFGKFSKVVRVK